MAVWTASLMIELMYTVPEGPPHELAESLGNRSSFLTADHRGPLRLRDVHSADDVRVWTD